MVTFVPVTRVTTSTKGTEMPEQILDPFRRGFRLGPVGGDSGDDVYESFEKRINGIDLYGDDSVVYSIRLHLDGDVRRIGPEGGRSKGHLSFAADEYIDRIDGRMGDHWAGNYVIQGLIIRTNKGNRLETGDLNSGRPFYYHIYPGTQIQGFWARGGAGLVALGAYLYVPPSFRPQSTDYDLQKHTLGPSGGQGGSPDSPYEDVKNRGRLKKVTIFADGSHPLPPPPLPQLPPDYWLTVDKIVGIKMEYVWGDSIRYGSESKDRRSLDLDSDDFLIKVAGRYGHPFAKREVVHSLNLLTHKGKKLEVSITEKDYYNLRDFSYDFTWSDKKPIIYGLWGRGAELLDSIGVVI